MAWRDSRGHRGKLILLTLCIVSGIAVLVAIQSLKVNMETAIDRQARTLLGADLALRSRQPFSEDAEAFIASLGGIQSRETRFHSMAYFVNQSQSRLVEVRAVEGDFPFYGNYETNPASVEFRAEVEPLVLVEDTLLSQYGVEPGEVVRIGQLDFRIVGRLLRVPYENEIRGIVSPRIYIDQRYLERTGLIKRGSLTRFRVYFQFNGGISENLQARLKDAKEGLFAEEGIRMDTVERRKRRMGRAMVNLYDYLNLVGFIALLLGGLGVAGAVQVYLKEKHATVAILRCLGTRIRDAFCIYLCQILAAGLIGSLLGAALGITLQYLLPVVLRPFLPIFMELFIPWWSVLTCILFGWGVTLLFALVPLLSLRLVTPLQGLRSGFETTVSPLRDPATWIVAASICLLTIVFSIVQTSEPILGLVFPTILGITLIVLYLLAVALRWSARRFLPRKSPYFCFLGLSNLYRPQNRTVFLIVTLGMGTLLVFTVYHMQAMLLQQAEFTEEAERPNMVLFDIQANQVESVQDMVREAECPASEVVPIVTMRLSRVNGRSVADIKNDPDSKIENWVLNWEYRTTFRDHLIDTEEIVAGAFVPRENASSPTSISVEQEIAGDLGVGVGDHLTLDLQGVPIEARIASIRKVDWAQLKPNFYIVFPSGVLEEAPAFYALVTRVPDRSTVVDLQRRLHKEHSNVVAIDLSLVLDTLTAIFDRVAFVTRFMASFTVLTGLVVLATSVITSRHRRLQESALLSALGASSSLVRKMLGVEFLLIGALAAVVGIVLSIAVAWGLAQFVFEIPYSVAWRAMPLMAVAAALLTLAIGLANSRGIANHPPLAVLRKEY